MRERLKNYVAGQWVAGGGGGTTLTDPITGEALGGLRALGFYHRRSAIQASNTAIDALTQITHLPAA
ncbi:hypothetical protein [Paraburkholderia sp. GAS348]|uniref:hypothetical protein n=1 Tax=Paraburkholderia sp. GAS348 TaxID=3035132 RepID=UPI003D1976F5